MADINCERRRRSNQCQLERSKGLHSREIVIPISKKEPVRVTAPAPEHMRERLRACGWNGE